MDYTRAARIRQALENNSFAEVFSEQEQLMLGYARQLTCEPWTPARHVGRGRSFHASTNVCDSLPASTIPLGIMADEPTEVPDCN